MLNEEEIRSLIVMRIMQAVNAGTYAVTHRLEWQLRDLIMVLTGEIQQPTDHIPDSLDAAKIPYFMNDDGGFSWDADWLEAHGFIFDRENEGPLKHPKFGDW